MQSLNPNVELKNMRGVGLRSSETQGQADLEQIHDFDATAAS